MASSIEGFRAAVRYSNAPGASYGVIPKERLQPTLERLEKEICLLNEANAAFRDDPFSKEAQSKLGALSRTSVLGGSQAEDLWRALSRHAEGKTLLPSEKLEALKTEGPLPELAKKLGAARELIANALASRPDEDLNVRGPVLDQLIRNAEKRGQDAHWAIRADQTGNSDFEVTRSEVEDYQRLLGSEMGRDPVTFLFTPFAQLSLGFTFSEAESQVAAKSKKE